VELGLSSLANQIQSDHPICSPKFILLSAEMEVKFFNTPPCRYLVAKKHLKASDAKLRIVG